MRRWNANKSGRGAIAAVLGSVCWVAVSVSATAGDPGQVVEFATKSIRARFHSGSLAELRSSSGTLLSADAGSKGLGIHAVGRNHVALAGQWEDDKAGENGARTWRATGFDPACQASAELSVRPGDSSGDLVLRQQCATTDRGVWGVSWAIGGIPLDSSIIVPGQSGVRLTSQAPGREFVFDYPMGWEAGLVIVEGAGEGFFVWADDPKSRFKRLEVKRSENGWSLRFLTINPAPFDSLTASESVDWRLNTYRGDWRVPARRYRDWMEQSFRPVPLAAQHPEWVQNIRAMVITGMSRDILEALPQRFDPAQTMLYVPDWREAGYDRDYPVYERPRPELDAFLEQAHKLGFRVMLHVNYFGVDPLNPSYAQFEPHQVRSPWGKHEKEWWLWTRATPEIRFAYINPAYRPWRECFTSAMVKLCREHRVDALHLDQTLCIYNDHNGLIDGLSMVDGNILLHRELRQALPEVALSGEGLNEITFRDEAFAQRHVRGLNHAEGTWDRRWLALAHPVSSYLFRPYVIINGYLGCAPPESAQLYAAWNEAYEHWGVIPTLKPSLESLRSPKGFARQFFDENRFWLQTRLDPFLDSAWPAGVAFPFRTADGRSAARMNDGRFVCGDQVISRTITGVSQVSSGGSVPGWRGYDREKLLGLHPSAWYPWFPEEPDPGAFHVSALPEGVTVEGASVHQDFGWVRLGAVVEPVANLVDLLDEATVISRPFNSAQSPVEHRGGWTAPDGGGFTRAGDAMLAAHPPYKVNRNGEALACFGVDLPAGKNLRFRSGIQLDEHAMDKGRSDGVTFGCVARAGETERHVQMHHASETRAMLELDLTPLAGKRAEIELSVGPGPAKEASFDWARWVEPRIETLPEMEAAVGVSGGGSWKLALGGAGPVEAQESQGITRFKMPVPGSCLLLRNRPPNLSPPADLCRANFWFLALRSGETIPEHQPDFVGVHTGPAKCGGVERHGFSAHPPDHGQTLILLPVTLGPEPAKVHTWVGLRDGSTSEGVIFRIEVNGQEVARRPMLPGGWEPLEADLGKWRGQPVVLGLGTDSDGSFSFDWAWWGEPRLERGK